MLYLPALAAHDITTEPTSGGCLIRLRSSAAHMLPGTLPAWLPRSAAVLYEAASATGAREQNVGQVMYHMHVMHTSRKTDLFLLAACIECLRTGTAASYVVREGSTIGYHSVHAAREWPRAPQRRAGMGAADTMAAAWGA